MDDHRQSADLIQSLRHLAGALEPVEDRLGAEGMSAEATRLAAMIHGYLIPRLVGPSQPVVVVFAGPTGSGKSTLLNTLAGSDVSRVGALRPTTTRPVVLAAPRHASRYGTIAGRHCRVVMGNASFLDTMTFVDTPDLDSTELAHRAAAEALVDLGDIVVFITSALRYADEVPWQVLRRAVARGAPVINVLNRVSATGSGAVSDFRSRLASEGLDDEIVIVPEHNLAPGSQRLPALAARSLWKRLDDLITTGAEGTRDTHGRVLRSVMDQVDHLVSRLDGLAANRGGLQSGLAARLSARVADLDLAGVGLGMHSPPPAGRRRSAWVRRNRRSFDEVADLETTVAERIVDLARADLRGWLADDGNDLPEGAPAPASLDEVVTEAVAPNVEGWISFVRRIADEQRVSNPWLAEAVLVDSALAGEASAGAMALFGENAATLVYRAARELTGRLEDAYASVAASLASTAHPPEAATQAERLRAAKEAVSSRLAPVHA